MAETRVILHADMDAFYAAIEQRDDPDVRGRPVIVGGLGRRGVVSTASYEAREFGVHSAMPTARARRLCPDGIYLQPRMHAYAEVSRQVRDVFARFTPLIEPLSLDEAFLDVTGSALPFGSGVEIAREIKRLIRERTELTVSIGVAATKFVAKVASDLDKPDGLVVVEPGDEAFFLAPLPVKRLWGAGRVAQKRFLSLGLATIGQVAELDETTLIAHFGEAMGRHYYAISHGRDPRRVVADRETRSISHETTFDVDLNDTQECHAVLLRLAEGVGRRLRDAGLCGRTVRLKLRYPPFRTLTRQVRLDWPTCDDVEIYRHAVALFDRVRPEGQPVRLLGVGTAGLVAKNVGRQRHLFGPSGAQGKQLLRAIDDIRDRFGKDTLRRGTTTAGPEEEI